MDIEVKGDIIEDDNQWIYDWIGWSYTSARNVLEALKKANGEDVLVKINSPGGSVFAASEIYTALRSYKGNVNIEIHGLAASAASVIAMAGHSKMSPTGQMMVHNVLTSGVGGDYRVMEHTAEMLRSANMTIANAYIDKTGMTEEEALNLMDNETWLTAERALELGMIDEIMFRNTNINVQNKQLKGLYNSFSSIPKELLDQLKIIKNMDINQPNSKVDFLVQKAHSELEFLKLKEVNLNMDRTEYFKQRNELIEKAQSLLNEGKIEEFNTIKTEIENLDKKYEEAAVAQANLNALIDNVSIPAPIVNIQQAQNKVNFSKVLSTGEDNKKDEKEVYLFAWAKNMQNKPMTEEEDEIFNKINFDFRNAIETAKDNQILIPETVRAGIWREAGELYPLFGDVAPTYIEGDLTIIKETSSGDDAAWYDEATEVTEGDFELGELKLTGCELAKDITISWKLQKMSTKEFIPYITTLLAEKMGAALGKAVYVGKGKPGSADSFKAQPKGIKTALAAEASTPQIVKYAKGGKVSYDSLTEAMATIGKYSNGACIYANNKTIWTHLAQIKDTTGRPIFIPDPTSGGVGRILGKVLKEEDSIGDGEVLIGNVKKAYVMNINENVSLYKEEHVKGRKTDYMTYSIVDGDILTTKAFALLQESAS